MALLQTQQQEDENQQPSGQQQPQQSTQQVQPTAQVQPMQSNIPAQQAPATAPQVQQKQPVKKGTGFTNLSRIMQANRGSALGQTVAGGISGQAAAAQQGIQTAQQRFEDQAQKARLDTDEAKAKREDIVGRFDPSKYQVDESKFQVSEGLQSQYGGVKSELESQKNTNLNKYNDQIDTFQNKLAQLQVELDKRAGTNRGGQTKRERAHIQQEFDATTSVLNMLKSNIQNIDTEISKKLQDLETQYGEMTEAERNSFIEQEKEKLIAERAPTSQEIQDFTKYRTGTYTGPTELQDSTSLFGKAAQTEALGQMARSTGGREELLKRFVGGKDYTSGQRLLDTTILGQERDSGVSEAARQTRGTVSDVQRANLAATQKAQEFAGRAKEFGKETTRRLEEQASPFTSELDTRLQQMQAGETKRTEDFGTYQAALSGADPKYQGMDPIMRAGTVLQDAANKGYLDQAELTELMGADGKTGLLQRALDLGLDPSKMLAERLQSKQAQGLTRAGVASKEEAATLNALNQLLGRQPSELEFREGREQFTRGGVGLGASELRDYITKTEAERAQKDPVYAEQLAQRKPTYLEQAIGGAVGTIGGVPNIAGAAFGTALDATDPTKMFTDPGAGLENAANLAGTVGQTALANQQMMMGGKNAVLEGLLKFNVGGNSIANTEAGKQMLKALEFSSMLENEALKLGGNVLNTGTETLSQLGRGNISDAFETLLAGGGDTINQVGDLIVRSDIGKVGGNIAREIGGFVSNAAGGFGAGSTGHWAGHRLGALGGGKIGDYVDKSSDVIMDEFNKISQATRYGKWYDRYEALNTLNRYYQAAVERENQQKAAQSAALQRLLTGNK